MFNQIKAIMKKELRDASRDMNSLTSALLYAFMGPVMLFIMFTFAASEKREMMENREISIISEARSELLEEHFLGHNFKIIKDAAIKLYVGKDFEENISKGLSPQIILKTDISLNYKELKLVEMTLERLNETVAFQRMIARGISPATFMVIDVQIEDSNVVSYGSSMMIKLILVFIATAGLYSSMSIAIDMTAGERERLSLEPLLTQPVSANTVIIGKLMIALLFAFAGTFITLGLDVIALNMAPMDELGIKIAMNFTSVLKVMLLITPFVISLTAIQIGITLFAKSYKEGMTYMMIFTLIVTGINFLPEKFMAAYNMLPYVSELVNMKAVLTGAVDDIPFAPISILGHMIITALCIYYAGRKIGQERMLG